MDISATEFYRIRKIITDVYGNLDRWEDDYLKLHVTRYIDTLKLLPPAEKRDLKLLDIGCFPGHLAVLAANRGYSVFGINSNIEEDKVYEKFNERMIKKGIPVSICNVETETFPFDKESFDVVLCCELIEHLYINPYHMLKETFRVLKRGGLFILTTPNLAWGNNITGLIRGISPHPSLERPFNESFSSILYHRHNREYTAKELVYMLEEQDKEPYIFEIEEIYYSGCYDANLKETIRDNRGKELFFSLFSYALKKINRKMRSTLMIMARKKKNMENIECKDISGETGLYDVEIDHADYQGFTRTITIPFRWTKGKASFSVPIHGKDSSIILTLLLANIAPPNAPKNDVYIFANKTFIRWLPLNPGTKLSRIKLFIDRGLLSAESLRLSFFSDTWRPSDFGLRDDREIGVLIGWESFLIEQIGKESDDLYHYDIKHDIETSIRMGKRGEKQLRDGWYHLEDWKRIGYVRWTQKNAYFIMFNEGKRSLYINMYSGAKDLKEGVKGALLIERILETGYDACRSYSFSMPVDTWATLKFDLPENATGLLRFCINVEKTRNPSKIVEGSPDDRELGIVVKEIELK